jgi:hypothetical protein
MSLASDITKWLSGGGGRGGKRSYQVHGGPIGFGKIELSKHVVAIPKLVAVTAQQAMKVLDCVTLPPGPQYNGYPRREIFFFEYQLTRPVQCLVRRFSLIGACARHILYNQTLHILSWHILWNLFYRDRYPVSLILMVVVVMVEKAWLGVLDYY